MKMVNSVVKLIAQQGHSLDDVAHDMGLSPEEIVQKDINGMDFTSSEMKDLAHILHIDNPYKFFYKQGGL